MPHTDFDTWQRFREELCHNLDPVFSAEEIHRIAIEPNLATFLVFEKNEPKPIGMLELSLRNIVDACLSSPVAYIEGALRGRSMAEQGHRPKNGAVCQTMGKGKRLY